MKSKRLFLASFCVATVCINVARSQQNHPDTAARFGVVVSERPKENCLPEDMLAADTSAKDHSNSVRTSSSAFPLYSWPLEDSLHNGFVLVNYVDNNSTSKISDYMGLPHSYNGHNGTDITQYNFRAMDRGAKVISASEGIVTAVAYSNFDRNNGLHGGSSNLVIVTHADNTRAWYYHLRKNSVTVDVGEFVRKGDVLGLVGSSGNSTDSHLHFETRSSSNVPRDPWNGTFNTLPSLWENQEPYVGDAPLRIYDVGSASQASVGGNIANFPFELFKEGITQPVVFGINEPYIMVWLLPQANIGDTYTLSVRRPDGSIFRSVNQTFTYKHRYGWHYWYWDFSGFVSPSDYGTWSYTITSGPSVLAHQSFTVGPSTIYGPRFSPLAGKSFRLNGTTQRDTLRVSWLGGAVTYSLLNVPGYVSLLSDSVVTLSSTANPMRRSSFFQAIATDANFLRDTMWYHVVNPNTRPLTLGKIDVQCHATNTGRIVATFGSGAGYSLSLNGGTPVQATSPHTFNNLPGGTYIVSLSDAYGNTEQGTIVVADPPALNLELSRTDATCFGISDGSIVATFSGGTPTLRIKIDDGSFAPETSPKIFSNLSPGFHVITVQDGRGCIIIDSLEIGQPENLDLSLSGTSPLCFGVANGSIVAHIDSTVGTSISLNNGSFVTANAQHTFTHLAAGKHFVTIKNTSNCTRTDSIVLLAPPPLTLSLSKTDADPDSANGSITATFGGGTPGYSIDLNGGGFVHATSPHIFSNLVNDFMYNVTIKDTVDCTWSDSIYLSPDITMQYLLTGNWNLISVPLTLIDYDARTVFPTAISSAFSYQARYNTQETLTNGQGYWLKFSSDQSWKVSGTPRTIDTFHVDPGWNIVGSISIPILASNITSEPPGIVTSQFLGYAGNYYASDSIVPGKAYWIRVAQVGKLFVSPSSGLNASNQIRIVTTIDTPPPPPRNEIKNIPEEFSLEQNHPNPFNPVTGIQYALPVDSRVSLKVYDVLGQEVATLVDGIQEAGYQQASWNSTNVHGNPISSGVYFYRIEASGITNPQETFIQVRKMMIMK